MIKKYFGTDGIRGRVNDSKINGEMFFKFGLAAGTYFKNLKKSKQTAIIAKDTRLSGYTLEPALVSGLASTVIELGISGYPGERQILVARYSVIFFQMKN